MEVVELVEEGEVKAGIEVKSIGEDEGDEIPGRVITEGEEGLAGEVKLESRRHEGDNERLKGNDLIAGLGEVTGEGLFVGDNDEREDLVRRMTLVLMRSSTGTSS